MVKFANLYQVVLVLVACACTLSLAEQEYDGFTEMRNIKMEKAEAVNTRLYRMLAVQDISQQVLNIAWFSGFLGCVAAAFNANAFNIKSKMGIHPRQNLNTYGSKFTVKVALFYFTTIYILGHLFSRMTAIARADRKEFAEALTNPVNW